MTDDPSIDPIEAFLWLYSGLSSDDTDTRKAAEITKRIHTALSTDEIILLDRACKEALKTYQRKLMGTPEPEEN
jgi:hypothetical protein